MQNEDFIQLTDNVNGDVNVYHDFSPVFFHNYVLTRAVIINIWKTQYRELFSLQNLKDQEKRREGRGEAGQI
jgi:hypothetical protein